MFGDYEAQRHWQEVTYNLPVHEWYFNTTNNDLNYWGLDYPPLTAYHSLVCAYVAKLLNPEWVELYASRGYESHSHKLFMRATGRFFNLAKISLTVLVTFALCWMPFLSDPKQPLQVLHRLFPVDRGLFEDKVANTWCSLNVLIKIKTLLSRETQLFLSFALTLLFNLPSSLKLLSKPTLWQFKLALVNSSLAFFLFSFQVHEKSILLAAFMLPLLVKDGLLLPYVVTSLAFLFLSLYLLSALERSTEEALRLGFYHQLTQHWLPKLNLSRIIKWKFWFSLAAMAAVSFMSVWLEPPAKFPDLFPVLVSILSFLHFLGFVIYFNLVQLMEPQRKKSQKKTN
ncbi:dolichyl pyrophosphate Man9 c2 alpha-1,3-glucosyltransferase [Labeo rohita]|uniref:Alpha-1,3-glucosyltransferase n=1 Tax=Labeo rohita TaxID=84645 RepID=A0A498NVF7_LABRO|nr:dolichyl pyrophosphate Man9 c2 alpha-1,3-glucosyltransferase [Labeo rohita]